MSKNQLQNLQSQIKEEHEQIEKMKKWRDVQDSSENRFQKIISLFEEIRILDKKIQSWLLAWKIEDLEFKKKQNLSVIQKELTVLRQEHNYLQENCPNDTFLFKLSILISTREMAIISYSVLS